MKTKYFGLLLLSLFVLSSCAKIAENKKQTPLALSKEEQFKKDEYCKTEYSSTIKNEVAERWDTKEWEKTKEGYMVNLKEIFYSPLLNECVYSYELNFYHKLGNSGEYIIARAPTGDIIIDKSYMSTYEKDKSYDFSYNVLQFENKVKELKQN